MKVTYNFKRNLGLIILSSWVTSCATLLMLPDELSEEHYRKEAGDIKPQIQAKLEASPGGSLSVSKGEAPKTVSVLPVVYLYDTQNTLGKNEEAYYTSVFNNSSGSWLRPFAVQANNHIRDQFKARGIEATLFGNKVFENAGVEQLGPSIDRLAGRDGFRGVAFNAENEATNYAVTDLQSFRKYIGKNDLGVAYLKIQVDWEPSSANRLHGDIVLNTSLKIGYEFVLCGAQSGCTTIKTPFDKGITTNLFMPNRNTIDDDGLTKNYQLIRDIHGQQLNDIVTAIFKKLDAMGTFGKT